MTRERKALKARIVSRRHFLQVAAGTSVGLVLAACAPAQPTPAPKPPPATSVAPAPPAGATPPAAVKPEVDAGFMRAPEPNPKRGGTLRLITHAVTPHFDLYQGADNILVSLYDPLIRWNIVDGLNSIIPCLAKRWTISPDGKEYTFYLREGVKFHDGTPLSSADVVATLKRAMFPPQGMTSVYREFYGPVDGVEAPDPLTVKFTLKKPYAPFLYTLVAEAGVIYPKKWLDDNNQDLRKVLPPGTGPFKFKEHKAGEYWLFEKNQNYWNPELPYVDAVRVLVEMTADARGTGVLTDQADWTTHGGVATFQEAQKRPDLFGARVTDNPTRQAMVFNCQKKPFDDRRVRRACFLAWNVPDMDELFRRYEPTFLSRWVTRGDPFAMPEEEIKKVPRYGSDKTADLAEAKRLLAEAGYADGIKDVDMICMAGHVTYHLAVAAQDWMKRLLNIEVKLRQMERPLLLEDEAAGNFQICVNWKGLPALTDFAVYGGTYFKTGAGQNTARYSNQEFDKLLEQFTSELDTEKRKRLIRQAEDVLDQDPPWMSTGFLGQSTIWRKTLKGMALEKRRISFKHAMDTGWLDR